MTEDFFRKLSKKEIDALTNVDLASHSNTNIASRNLLFLLLSYFVIVLCTLTFIILKKEFFINELRLMENVDLQFAEATLNQRIIKVIVLSAIIGVSAIINRYFSLIAVLVFVAAIFGLVDDFSMRITHSDDPFSLTASTVTILRLVAIGLIGKMILQAIGESSQKDMDFP
ncbi:hypothetical protein [Candidatus Puniceispirillum marinum]|uniref:Cytochrome c-type biogenesis protein ccmF n=1 Tax=Puniceispirillum marinum (strain IMCC1322) TaxID=488538 RepID=D5BRZ6_PUNMI|nr:hypothetical protein [Candidatus Puniceispirillum marinum]ADE39043.1 cytochrome c-type biogenesis protein ccmF [Candidatus Puniceispirillum marinum IMCC1322]